MILVRIIGKMIVGNPACRSPEWLDMGENFTKDFVTASLIMRLLPPWMHFLVTNLIPQRWRLRRRLRAAAKIVGPAIARHEEAASKRVQGIDVEEEDTMLNWMMDNGNDKEYVLSKMPTLVLVILVPAAHTTAMAISNILFDLCAHPEWDAKLRAEICDVTAELGRIGEGTAVKDWVSKLELLDSFFNESQRLSQPISSKSATSSSQSSQSIKMR
jgi:cytochrome P450